jgi:hypothetical protein
LRRVPRKHGFLGSRGQRLDSGPDLGFFHAHDRGVLPDKIFVEKCAGEVFDVVFFDGTQVLLRKTEFVGDLCDCAALMLACAPENSSYGVHVLYTFGFEDAGL